MGRKDEMQNADFMKSMDCIKAFREEAIQVTLSCVLFLKERTSQERDIQHSTDKPGL